MSRRLAVVFAVVLGSFALVAGAASRPRIGSPLIAQGTARIDFARDVQPIFRQHCIGCHGSSQQMNGLRLDRRRDAMRGGSAGGVVIRAGNGDISPLYLKISGTTFGTQMPPTGVLRPEQIATVKQWIDEGAEWPDALAGDVPDVPLDVDAERLIEVIRRHDRASFDRTLKTHPAAISKRGDGGTTPLMWAALEGDVHAARALLDAGADPNLGNDVAATPLMWAIPDLPIVSLLLERGAKVNVKTNDGRTPLMRAAGLYGASAVVARLLEAGADPLAQGSGFVLGTNALVEAAYAADPESIRLLMARGADPAANGPAALYYALRADCTSCVEALLAKTPSPLLNDVAAIMSPPNEDGRHLLQLTARGVDVNTKDGEGRTLLMLAASSDRILIGAVKMLIAKGADVRAQSKDGRTAADYAALRGRTPVLDALLKAGAPAPKPLSGPPAPARASSTRDAVQRSLPLLQKSAATFWKKSGCVSCHNNTLTAETLAAARTHRFTIDELEATRQRRSIGQYLETWRERALQGIGIPGDTDTVSYILLGLGAEKHPADRATDAMARFLLDHQSPDGEWLALAHRPPLESSAIEVTASAMHALQLYGAGHSEASAGAIRRAAAWIEKAAPQTTEDRVFQLLGVVWAGTRQQAVRAAVRALQAAQRPDGGWSQLPTLESDAYATGQAIVALTLSGLVPRDDASRRRGVEFLMNTQLADGSWYVRTRSLPIQPYFEVDFPHGRDQFISSAATNWATRALLLNLQ
jgi:ankyrin repeat protein/mono/diheme cytochrome c family protein